jgi:hypothetical protein
VDTVSNVSTTLRLVPYQGRMISVWNGASWSLLDVGASGISLALGGLAANTNYDVTLTSGGVLVLTAWGTDTTRAIVSPPQDGIIMISGNRYVGTVRAISANQIVDGPRRRFVWNYQNRVERSSRSGDVSGTWAPGGTWSQMFAATPTSYTHEFVIGLDEDAVESEVTAAFRQSANDPTYRLTVSESPAGPTTSRSLVGGTYKDVASGIVGTDSTPSRGAYRGRPGIGYRVLYGIDMITGSVGAAGLATSSAPIPGFGAMSTVSKM